MADSLFDIDHDDKDYLAELTGPGGKFDKTKYASEAEMYKAIAKSNYHGDRTIAQRNTEMDELRAEFLRVRDENVAKAKWEDILKQRAPDEHTASTSVSNVEQPILDLNKIDEFLEQKLVKREQERIEKDNLAKVESRLRERFGEDARAILRDKMSTLNITDEDLKFLARKSPEAVFNTLGLNVKQESFQAPPRSSLRSDNFHSEAEIRDALYYEKLRQTDSKKYFDPKISVQRLKDMESPEFFTRYNQRRT